jgi:hypothetical protein
MPTYPTAALGGRADEGGGVTGRGVVSPVGDPVIGSAVGADDRLAAERAWSDGAQLVIVSTAATTSTPRAAFGVRAFIGTLPSHLRPKISRFGSPNSEP